MNAAEDRKFDMLVETGVTTPYGATARISGQPKKIGNDVPTPPRRYPKPGNVYDYTGRPDEYRGGSQLDRWLTLEEAGRLVAGRALARAATTFYAGLDPALPAADRDAAYKKFLETYLSGQDSL